MLRGDYRNLGVGLRIDEQHRGTGVLDDVLDLFCPQPEVDRDENPTRCGHRVVQLEVSRGVRRNDGDPLPNTDPELVESSLQRPHPARHLAVRQLAERVGTVRVVDDADARRENRLGPSKEVRSKKRHLHGTRPYVQI